MKNIVVLGAGFAGLRCALDLSRKVSTEWKVVLLDRNPYHIYFPRLYELAVPHDGKACTIDIPKILKGSRIEFIQGEIKDIDCKGKAITLADGKSIPFKYLVLALGAGTDYFDIEGLEKYSRTLKSIDDAKSIRQQVEDFLNGVRAGKKDLFEVVIGGAGATGVEVAAEMAYLFQDIPRGLWSVRVVEALSAVLWMFPPEVSKYAYHRLTKLGVHVMLDTCIKSVHKNNNEIEVVLAPRPLKPGETEAALVCSFLPEHEKRISADLLLWAGGVRATPLLSRCALPVDRKGRMEVDEYLRVKNFDNVFAIGDDATLINPKDQRPVPATAQAAIEQGRLVAKNILNTLQSKTLIQYRFHEFPAIVPLGGHAGVAYVGGRVFTGLSSWFLRKAADCRYLASILGWWNAFKRCIM